MIWGGDLIAVVPLGPVCSQVLDSVLLHLGESLGFNRALLPFVDLPDRAWDVARGQYFGREIFSELENLRPREAACVLGITEADLGSPVLTFIFGEARVSGRVALVSTCRLREEYYLRPPDQALLLQRLTKEVVHELGHAFGLVHCTDSRCVMYRSASLGNTDAKQDAFCFWCETLLKAKG